MSWGALAGIALGAADAWYTNRKAEKNAHEQMDFQQYMFQNRYQMQVRDLQAAGLNPMLAYGQSPGSAPQGSAAPVQKSDAGRIYNESRLASAQEANITAQTQKAYAETNNIDADTLIKAGMPSLIAAQVVQATSSAAQADATVKSIQATIPKLEAEVKHIKTQIEKDKSNIKLNQSLIEANNYLNGLRVAETYLTNAKARLELQQGDVLEPKARAAKGVTAELGHTADNIGKIGSAAWKFLFPSLTNP